MKTLTITILLLALAARLTAIAGADTAEVIVGLSPFQPAAKRVEHEKLLQFFLLKHCPTPARVTVWDAWNQRVISDIELPRLAYDSPAARVRNPRCAQGLAALKRWFNSPGDGALPLELKDSAAINIPEWLQAATAQPAAGARVIVLLASPFALVPTEPSFSMANARYPSDGHLAAAAERSIYSIADKRGRIEKTTVLWAFPNENAWVNQLHRYQVARWWSLFVAGQGGLLAEFSADAQQVLIAAARTQHRPIGEFLPKPDDAAVTMHSAQRRDVPLAPSKPQAHVPPPPPAPQPVAASVPLPVNVPPVAIAPPPAPPAPPPVMLPVRLDPPGAAPQPEPPAKMVAAIPVPSEIPKPPAGNIGIAAVWTSEEPGSDIDLYVAPKPGLPEASFKRADVPGAKHFRDIRSSQPLGESVQWRVAWEYVEIQTARLDEPSVWLNCYYTKAPVRGFVRVQFNDRVVDTPFEFKLTYGNRGGESDLAARSVSQCWIQIRLIEMFPTAAVGQPRDINTR